MGNAIGQIGILGAGQMGDGIAQTAAQTGFVVLLADQNLAIAEKGKARIASRLNKMVEKGKLAECDAREQLAAIRPVDGIAGLCEC